MQEMLEFCSTLTGAGMMAFLGFIVVGITIFVAASLVWRDNLDYWTDIAGILMLCAAVSFALAVITFLLLMIWGIGAVASDSLLAAFVIILASGGWLLAEYYLKNKMGLGESTQIACLWGAAGASAFAVILFIAVSCAYLAEIRAALAR